MLLHLEGEARDGRGSHGVSRDIGRKRRKRERRGEGEREGGMGRREAGSAAAWLRSLTQLKLALLHVMLREGES